VRQRVWYALRRNGLTFAFPTRTLFLERSVPVRPVTAEDQIADRLSAVDIFSPLSADELRQLAKATAGHVFAPGETLIRVGDEGSSMFVVHSGRVAVQLPDRGRPRTVAELTEGNFFGEMALFTGEPRTANVVALEETEVLEIGHAAMKHLFQTNPGLAESISWTITERQADLAKGSATDQPSIHEPGGLLSSIKRFFSLR
jgi:CRP-like cAMP-binding protein